MKPLFHPAVEDVTVEGVLHALSDPVRIMILQEIMRAQGPQTCSAFLRMDDRILPKSTLSQHFRVLREAGLIRSERKGVELHNSTRCEELKPRFGEMIRSILAAYAAQDRNRTGTPPSGEAAGLAARD
jgi:DNA-binding transcriptional ArsR family regulator